jgi:hypothetical protein
VPTLREEALAALRAPRARQAEDRRVLGADYDDRDLIFCTRTGAVATPTLRPNIRPSTVSCDTAARVIRG